VRAYNPADQKARAAKLIYRFVVLIGPHFFPNVKETEYQLKRVLQTPTGRDYSLRGVVDVLSGAVSHSLGLPYSTEADDIEIWDYKSGEMPDKSSLEMKSYEYQMRVYAELYRQQTGDYPARCVLVFVGELGNDKWWIAAAQDPTKFPKLIYPIHPVPRHVQQAVDNFHQTVEDIEVERAKPYEQQWLAPIHPVDKQTCEACELRFNCSSFPRSAIVRAEAL
jgi:putative RecB family exonuclease